MANMIIKASYLGFNFEIEGDSDTAKEVFEEIKNDIICKLISTPVIEIPPDDTPSEEECEKKEAVERSTGSSNKTSIGKKNKVHNNSKISNYTLIPIASEHSAKLITEYNQYERFKSLPKKITLLIYLYSKIDDGFISCDENLAYTLFRTVGERIPKRVEQALRDAKSKDNYLDKSSDGTGYILTHLGENLVKLEAKKKN